MKSEKIMPGIILVIIGALFLLNNYNVINFHWSNILHLWPIFLIMGGVNLLLANNKAPWAYMIKIAVVVLGFGLLVFGRFENNFFFPKHSYSFHDNDYDSDDDSDDDDDDNNDGNSRKGIVKVEGSSTFNEPYNAAAAVAKLHISGGGVAYTLNDTTNQLFNAVTKEFSNKFEFTRTMEGTVPALDLRMKKRNGNNFNWDSDKTNSANIKLNANPEWDISVDAGATELNFDLSKFKVRNFKLSGGAASFDVKIGQPLASTVVDVSTGVSEVEIRVPQNAACQITSNSGLSSTDFDGFNKVSDNTYETAGFAAAKTKIYVKMKGGVSDFKVTRY